MRHTKCVETLTFRDLGLHIFTPDSRGVLLKRRDRAEVWAEAWTRGHVSGAGLHRRSGVGDQRDRIDQRGQSSPRKATLFLVMLIRVSISALGNINSRGVFISPPSCPVKAT